MSLLDPYQAAREKHGIVFAPRSRGADGASPQGHSLFLTNARAVDYNQLVDTCVSAHELKTCAAVLLERYCMDNRVDKAMLQQLLKHPKDVAAFDCAALLARWDSEGEVDFTTLPQDTLHSLVLGFPLWHEALRRVRATTTSPPTTGGSTLHATALSLPN